LVITMSQYSSGGHDQLAASKNDGDEFEKFLIKCNFKVTRIHDEKDEVKISNEFTVIDNILAKAKGDSKNVKQTNTAAFIYYSGHGFLVNGKTMGLTISGKRFPLEEKVRNMCTRTNCFVIGLFDCCREIPDEGTKGSAAAQGHTRGQLLLIHAVGPGKFATTRKDANGLSDVTRDFLRVMESAQGTFPECIDQWRRHHQTVEIVEKALYQFHLKPETSPASGLSPIKAMPYTKKFKEWLPHEIAEWTSTLNLTKSYSAIIMEHQIGGAGILAIIELSAWISFGFDVKIDSLIIKAAAEKAML